MKTYLRDPRDGPRDKAETAILCRGPGPTRKKKDILPVVGRRRAWKHMCPCGGTIEGRTHIVEECEIYTRRNGMR